MTNQKDLAQAALRAYQIKTFSTVAGDYFASLERMILQAREGDKNVIYSVVHELDRVLDPLSELNHVIAEYANEIETIANELEEEIKPTKQIEE